MKYKLKSFIINRADVNFESRKEFWSELSVDNIVRFLVILCEGISANIIDVSASRTITFEITVIDIVVNNIIDVSASYTIISEIAVVDIIVNSIVFIAIIDTKENIIKFLGYK